MIFLFNYLIWTTIEMGGFIGDVSPLGRLASHHNPTPSFTIFTAFKKWPLSPEINFAFYSHHSYSFSNYNLTFYETFSLLNFPLKQLKSQRSISLLGSLNYLILERRVKDKKEQSNYFGYGIGFGYSEQEKRVRFRINFLLLIIPEERFARSYFSLHSRIGVGYEIFK